MPNTVIWAPQTSQRLRETFPRELSRLALEKVPPFNIQTKSLNTYLILFTFRYVNPKRFFGKRMRELQGLVTVTKMFRFQGKKDKKHKKFQKKVLILLLGEIICRVLGRKNSVKTHRFFQDVRVTWQHQINPFLPRKNIPFRKYLQRRRIVLIENPFGVLTARGQPIHRIPTPALLVKYGIMTN